VDDSKYDVKIDYLALKFRPSKMLAKYTLPEGSKLVSVRKCCSSSIDVTHEVSGPTVAVELSEYMDFENMYYSIEYTYTYTITISDYYVTQKTIISLSPYETPQTELEYSESMRISMPYSHKITIEAEPSISATSLTQLRVSDKERTVNNEKGSTQKFEMEGSGTINLVYRLRNAYSFKSEHLYNQTSANPMNPSWSSRYSLRRGYDVELSNVSIRHELVGDRNRTTVDIKPVTDWYTTQSGQIIYIHFPSLKNDVIVTVQEATAGLSVNYTHPIQVTNPISIGSSPVFLVNIGLINPSERDASYNISRGELLSMLPDLRRKYPELADDHGEPLIADLRSREGATFQIYFNTSAVLFSETGFSQVPAVIGQPIQWKNTIQLKNPGTMRYENVTWNVSVSPEAYDCTIDDSPEGELGEGTFKYTESALEPSQKRNTPSFVTPLL